jgi:hypothetical protein
VEKLIVSHKSCSLAFDEVKEESQSHYGLALEPKLNLLVKSKDRNSVSPTHIIKHEDIVSIVGRITVSF